MEGIKSSVVLFALLLAIFGPTVTFGNKRTCFCEAWILPTGASLSDGRSDIRVLDIDNPVYRRRLYLGCSSPRRWCPGDCKKYIFQSLGGRRDTFTSRARDEVCDTYGNAPQGLSVWANYEVSNCGTTGTIEIARDVSCS